MIHDIIKIKYVSEGYLPDWPYHLISDEEMFKAFICSDRSTYDFFHDFYPLQSDSYLMEYEALKNGMQKEINNYLSAKLQLKDYTIPDWVYNYMLGKAIGPNSPIVDRHDMLVSLGLDNIDDTFNSVIYRAIYDISTKCISKLRYNQHLSEVRPPTIFGEAHVLKYLRLHKSNIEEV